MRENCDCVASCEACVEMPTKCSEKQASTTTPIYGHEKARCVEIEQLDFGYKVRVGCQYFAIESLSKVLELLDKYLHSPNKLEEDWRTGVLKF